MHWASITVTLAGIKIKTAPGSEGKFMNMYDQYLALLQMFFHGQKEKPTREEERQREAA